MTALADPLDLVGKFMAATIAGLGAVYTGDTHS
jgi:hypothetical protein